MPPNKIFTSGSYEVYEEGRIAVLRVGNSGLRFTWDTAIRISAKLRVHSRDAQEYMGMSRQLLTPDPERSIAARRKKVMHQTPVIMEGDYQVFTNGPDTILKVGNGELAMEPEMARNISDWLAASGERIRVKYFSDMHLKVVVANLTDATEQEHIRQQRRDTTAAFSH